MDPIERLSRIFEKFPGIGPRQAGRFVQFLLRSAPSTRRELVQALIELSDATHQCGLCMRYFSGSDDTCSICTGPNRDHRTLAIVASDTDLLALERSGTYRGMYFVIGGTISLATERAKGLRERELLESIVFRVKKGLSEVVLAFPANPEGDFTTLHVRDELAPYAAMHSFTITTLGRGLSTGSELEYADPDTLKSAFENRR